MRRPYAVRSAAGCLAEAACANDLTTPVIPGIHRAALMYAVDMYLLPASLWLVMFAMGLSLVAADFGKIAANRRAYLLGLLSMLVLVPLVGVGIATWFAPTPALVVGFILLGTCPGGLLSNLLTSLSRGTWRCRSPSACPPA